MHDRQIAGFGELTLAPNAQFNVTAGLRVYQFHTVEQITQGGLFGGPDLPKTSGLSSGVNPKLTATYEIDPSTSLYATASKGFREGGVNSGLVSGLDCTFISAYKSLYSEIQLLARTSLGADLDVPVFNNWAWFFRPNWQYVGSSPSSYTIYAAAARSRLTATSI